MTEKEAIFRRIRKALKETPRSAKPELNYDAFVASARLQEADDWRSFQNNFESVGGQFRDSIPDLAYLLTEKGCHRGYCDPALKDAIGDPLAPFVELTYSYSRDTMDQLQFGITQGSAVVAETGSILLTDAGTTNRLAALTPWVHVAVVNRAHLFPTLVDALDNLGNDPNIIWVTGPSKTADIEGVLIKGVHGPGEQICYRVESNRLDDFSTPQENRKSD